MRLLRILVGGRAGHAGLSIPLALAAVLAAPLLASIEADLAQLAVVDAAAGDEGRLVGLIAGRVGGSQRVGSDGSLVVRFGSGKPATLVVAGCDEPGLVVSGLEPDGYLRLDSLSSASQWAGLTRFFSGQHVRVSTASGAVLPAVIAAPSVHFPASSRSAARSYADLYLDVGATSSAEVREAGIGILDRVTLDKRVAELPGGWMSSPWISARAGAAVLLGLAGRLASENAGRERAVALAFASQQFAGNAGLTRILGSLEPQRLVLLVPAQGSRASVAPCFGGSDSLAFARGLADRSAALGLDLGWRSSYRLALGPFSAEQPWGMVRECAVLSPGARNSGTPAESVRPAELAVLEDLLAEVTGAGGRSEDAPPERAPSVPASAREVNGGLEGRLRRLVAAHGVSGSEGRVRELIQSQLPDYASRNARVDGAGNLIVRIGGAGAPAAAFLAHMDEIGLRVTAVRPGGELEVEPVGGGLQNLFAGHPSLVLGNRGEVDAVMPRERVLSVAATSSEEAARAGIEVGSTATVFKRYRSLLGGRVSARSLDDRLGCAALLEALSRLRSDAIRAKRPVDFVFTVREETGLQGAREYAARWTPRRVYPVDTFVSSDSPLESRRIAFARLGQGAVVRAIDQSGLTPRAEVQRVGRIARRNAIPFQVGVTAGGNDGSVFRSLDTVNVPIGFPLRYAHTPVETADLRDAAAVADLVRALAQEALAGR